MSKIETTTVRKCGTWKSERPGRWVSRRYVLTAKNGAITIEARFSDVLNVSIGDEAIPLAVLQDLIGHTQPMVRSVGA